MEQVQYGYHNGGIQYDQDLQLWKGIGENYMINILKFLKMIVMKINPFETDISAFETRI